MKKITELLSKIPLLTGLLIALGILRYIIFYKLFYVPITQYLQISEIILLFTEDIIFLLFALFVPRLVGYFEQLVNAEKEKSRIIQGKEYHQQAWKKYVEDFSKGRNFFLVGLCIVLVGLIVLGFSGDRFDRMIALYGAICLGVCFVGVIWERSLLTQNIRHELRQYLYFFMFFVLILFLICFRAVNEAQGVNNGEFTGTTITTKDSTYVSDSTHVYIGRTNQYTFIYNKTDKSSTVLSNSEIVRVILKTKNSR